MSAAPAKPKFFEAHGFKFAPVFTNAADSLTYQARPDDLFIVTYPRNGTTWTQVIVSMILNHGNVPEGVEKIWSVSPFLEADGKEAAANAKRPCAIKTHLPYKLQPKHPDSKIIVMIRNAKDVCVSFFNHLRMFTASGIADMSFSDFFPFWLEGEVECGNYFDFVLDWWNQRHDPNILIMVYEEMKADPAAGILKIAQFIGKEYSDVLEANNSEILTKIVNATSFNATKDALNTTFLEQIPAVNLSHTNQLQFARKGIVGDWRNHFTDEQSKEVDRVFRQKFRDTGLDLVWKDYDIFQYISH